jgi:hypothetical protein
MSQSPSFATTTKLVARGLGVAPDQLLAALRPATIEDVPSLVALRRAEFGDEINWDDEAYLSWRYHFGRADRGFGEVWVVSHGQELLGMIGVEDTQLQRGADTISAIRVMDILVRPTVRDTGLAAWLNQAMFRKSGVALCVGGNTQSIGTIKRLFETLPSRVLAVARLDFRPAVYRRLGRSPVTSLGAQLGNAALRGWRSAARAIYGGPFLIRPIARFDASLDALLQRARGDANPIDIVRSPARLNWRLFDNPRAAYQVHGAFRDDEWFGYIAWRTVQRDDDQRWAYVIDWLADRRQRSSALSELLAFVCQRASQEGCVHIHIAVQDPTDLKLLRRFRFSPAPAASEFVTLHTEDATFQGVLCAASWNLTGISSDVDAR